MESIRTTAADFLSEHMLAAGLSFAHVSNMGMLEKCAPWAIVCVIACTDSGPVGLVQTPTAATSCHDLGEGISLTDPTQPVALYRDGIAVGVREPTVFSDGNGGTRNVLVWKGLRFAGDTSGDGRWRPPVRAACNPVPQIADSYRSACLQSQRPDRNACPPVGSEDCLFLNVFVPDPALTPKPAEGYPVMVWIHGGNFEWGSGSNPSYRAHNLAAWGVVVVTINYRVGVMGFLAHDSFRSENTLGAAGNYGLMDQITALEWVRDNVRGFAGNPDNVTIFGQSAGGSSVNYHLTSTRSAGLFHRAIAHSGAGGLVVGKQTTDRHAAAVINRAAQVDGVDCGDGESQEVASCLRERSACALAAYDSGSYTPGEGDGGGTYASIDGDVLREDPTQAIIAGRHNDVPLMHGIDNRDDYSVVRQSVATIPTDQAGYDSWCLDFYGDYSEWICGAYPLSSYGAPINAMEAQFLDYRYECRQRRVRQGLARTSNHPVHAWVFADGLSFHGRDFAIHGDELPYLFANPYATGKTFDSAEWSMAMVLQSAWTSYAASATPGWDAWTESDPNRAFFENDLGCETLTEQTTCEAAGCRWSTALGCGFWRQTYDGPLRDAECDAIWDRLAPLCGDGRRHAIEGCDDGNAVDGDGCSSDCACESITQCGDQVCDPCETGITCSQDCGNDCRQNGETCSSGELCDESGTCRPA